jgi:diguanylate cyclase (GGDEF)-like protein
MQYKDKDAPAGSMAITIKIAFLIYATIPVYLAAIAFYRRAPFHAPTAGAAYGLVAVLVLCTFIDYQRLGSPTGRLRPWFSFFQICISITIITIVNLTAGGTGGIYYVLFLLPILIASVMGDLTMISATWVLSLAALGLVIHHKIPHHVDVLAWTLAVNGAAWGGAAMAIHFAVKQFLGAIHTAQTVSQLATEAQKVEVWPGGLAPCLPLLAEIMDAAWITVMAGPHGSQLEEIASFQRQGRSPTTKKGATGDDREAVAEGTRLAIDARQVQYLGNTTFVPNRTASGLDLVIVGTGGRAATPANGNVTNAVVAGQLVAGIVDRVSLIGGLREEALTDPLTGMVNRRGLYDHLDQAIGHASRSNTPLCVAMLDIDHFKEFNDRYGHLAGDAALRSLGALLRSGLRQQDVVARFGGEEFCIILPSTDRGGAVTVLEELRGTAGLTSIEAPRVPLPTFSAGVALWDGEEDRQSLLNRADVGLYQAKRAGRDTVITDDTSVGTPGSGSPAEEHPQHGADDGEHQNHLHREPDQPDDEVKKGEDHKQRDDAGRHQQNAVQQRET